MKSRWFKRLQKDTQRFGSHVRFKRIRHGFWRIFYDGGYLGEVYEDLPEVGYDIIDLDHRLEERKYVQDRLDDGEVQRLVKNFVEGYYEVLDTMRSRVYNARHNHEAYKTITEGYRQLRLK